MASGPDHGYPFSAVVGQDGLKLSLLLLAVDPGIGGVLVTGQKGTAKSTTVRALAALLPDQEVVEGCRFGCDPSTSENWCDDCRQRASDGPLPVTRRRPPLVELPVSATEDRLLGTLDFEHALTTGGRRFEPGLLAAANRGLLYVDEVNLLDDQLVDAMLDSAASGINTVEREGVACSHPARFALVGTMNPEEGEVRPQLLDRFGLSVRVAGLCGTGQRVEVVRRRTAFERDPGGFVARFAQGDADLAQRVTEGRARLADTRAPDDILYLIATICEELGVDGHRADIALARASAAHAALHGEATVSAHDVRSVAALALAHRLRRGPARDDDVAESLARVVSAAVAAGGEEPGETADGVDWDGAAALDGLGSVEQRDHAGPVDVAVPVTSAPARTELPGRRDASRLDTRSGRYVSSSVDVPSKLRDVALDATLRAAAGQAALDGESPPVVHIRHRDLRSKVRSVRTAACIMFCVDASGSMGASERIDAAKSAVLAVLEDAQRHRERVGFVAFRGQRAELLLAPTTSVEVARMRLADLRTGGSTPLASGIALAEEQLLRERRRDAAAAGWIVLITDGRANVGVGGGPEEDALAAVRHVRDAGLRLLVIDPLAGPAGSGQSQALARAGGGAYLHLEARSGAGIIRAVRRATALPGL